MSERTLGMNILVYPPPSADLTRAPPASSRFQFDSPREGRDGPQQALAGKRILLVEDEFLVGMFVHDLLQELECVVFGPVPDFACGLEAARWKAFDAAVLDINLDGEMSYSIAEELGRRGIPFLFTTGYSKLHMPEQFRSVPCLSKPIEPRQLEHALGRLLA
jgi:CheY-like chemotaxis protein